MEAAIFICLKQNGNLEDNNTFGVDMLKLATVFSGIGAIEQALKKQKIKYEIKFACDNGEIEISKSYDDIVEIIKDKSYTEKQNYIKELYLKSKKHNYMKDAYFANYDINEKNWYEDIRFIDGTIYKNDVDLFVGGSPCQSFSIMVFLKMFLECLLMIMEEHGK